MTKQLNNPFKNSKLKAIFFFLLLATFFWILTKFSRHYTATATAYVNYVNIPNTTLLTDENAKEITFDLSASGFEFLFYKLKRPTIEIDVGRYYSSGMDHILLRKNDLVRIISAGLNANLTIKDLSVEQLRVQLDNIVLKKVPVITETDFSFKKGFRQVDSIKISPDSIMISGPSTYLDTINFVKTMMLSEKNLDKNILKNVAIKEYPTQKISFDPKEVTVSVKVSEFSQKEIVLPIEVINLPENTIIKLIPSVVTVVFNVSVEEFKEITENDFSLICDYAKRNIEENFMIPDLIKSPTGIVNMEFDTKKIDYLIFK
jgi:hypothetical protein